MLSCSLSSVSIWPNILAQFKFRTHTASHWTLFLPFSSSDPAISLVSDEEDGGEPLSSSSSPRPLSPLSAHSPPLPLGGACQPPIWPWLAPWYRFSSSIFPHQSALRSVLQLGLTPSVTEMGRAFSAETLNNKCEGVLRHSTIHITLSLPCQQGNSRLSYYIEIDPLNTGNPWNLLQQPHRNITFSEWRENSNLTVQHTGTGGSQL